MIGTIIGFLISTGVLLLILVWDYDAITRIRNKTFFKEDPNSNGEIDYVTGSWKLFWLTLITGAYLYFYIGVWFYNNDEEVGEWDGCILRGPNGECEIDKYDYMPDPFDLREYE